MSFPAEASAIKISFSFFPLARPLLLWSPLMATVAVTFAVSSSDWREEREMCMVSVQAARSYPISSMSFLGPSR